jgi:RNA polymerase sigma factor (sigma-70 family)
MYFPTTQWSLLARASLNGETTAREALEELCRRYWSPLHQFIQSRGHSESEAQDLTQDFILHLIEHSSLKRADRLRGKFRSFLLGALVRFLANDYKRRRAQKRGAGEVHLVLDDNPDLACAIPPDAVLFDREWAEALLENAMRLVESEYDTRKGEFAVLRRFLPGSLEVPTYEEAAAQLRLSLPALKSELHRLRLRIRDAVRDEIASTVSAPHEIDEEVAYLHEVLMDKGNEDQD